MFPNECDDCFAEQEEYLLANDYNGGQVICWCYTDEDITWQYEKEQNWVEMPGDEELETAMMFLWEEDTNNENPMEDITEETSGDGFDQEILADYKYQDYEFVSDMAAREVGSPVDCLDWLFMDEDEASM